MIERAVVFGAGSGVGRATATMLAARGARVWAVARTSSSLDTLPDAIERAPGDAADPAVVDRVLEAADADLIVVALGARPRMAPVDEQSWDSFSAAWNIDVQAAFHVGQRTLRKPPRRGSTVVILSSGAGLGSSPLSGGYAGAKRMQMFLAGYLQQQADARGLGVRYVALVPRQLLVGTAIADAAAEAYGRAAGTDAATHMKQRFPIPLDADGVAASILAIAAGDAPAGTILSVAGGKPLEAI